MTTNYLMITISQVVSLLVTLFPKPNSFFRLILRGTVYYVAGNARQENGDSENDADFWAQAAAGPAGNRNHDSDTDNSKHHCY